MGTHRVSLRCVVNDAVSDALRVDISFHSIYRAKCHLFHPVRAHNHHLEMKDPRTHSVARRGYPVGRPLDGGLVDCNAAIAVVLKRGIPVEVVIKLVEEAVANVALIASEKLFVLAMAGQEENSG